VKGTLGDLLGQQFVIYVLLTIIIISLILLFISYVINISLLILTVSKKEQFIKKFNYKIVKFYIEYQSLLIKFSLIYIPIFIFAGLFILLHGLHFLITHTIPFELLGIDINTYLDNSSLINNPGTEQQVVTENGK
jgi:hypothetical protein